MSKTSRDCIENWMLSTSRRLGSFGGGQTTQVPWKIEKNKRFKKPVTGTGRKSTQVIRKDLEIWRSDEITV